MRELNIKEKTYWPHEYFIGRRIRRMTSVDGLSSISSCHSISNHFDLQ
jgi:hypothetical protein